MTSFGWWMGVGLAFASPDPAVAGPTKVWTLEACLEEVGQRHPALEIAAARVRESDANAAAARSVLWPRVAWTNNWSAQRLAFGSAFAGGARGSINPSFYSESVFGSALSVSQLVFPWQRAVEAGAGYDALTEAASAQRRAVEWDLRFQVARAFAGILLAEQAVLIAEGAVRLAEENERMTQVLYRDGKVSAYDVAKANAQRLQAAAARVDADGQRRVAAEGLRSVVGMTETVQIQGTLAAVPVRDPVERLEARALEGRADREGIAAQIRAAEAGSRAADLGGWPVLTAAGGYQWLIDRLGLNPDEWYKSWNVSVQLTIPLVEGGANEAQAQAARAKTAQARGTGELADRQIRLEVRQAHIQVTTAEERLASRREQVRVAEENWRIAQERYRLGLLSLLELKDAELALTQAQTERAQALYDHVVARASLERAVGGPVP